MNDWKRKLDEAEKAGRVMPITRDETVWHYTSSSSSAVPGGRWYQGIGEFSWDRAFVLVADGAIVAEIQKNETPDAYGWDRYKVAYAGPSRLFATRKEAVQWVEGKILAKIGLIPSGTP